MRECDDRSGLNDGYTAKLLHPDTPSGRQLLQYLTDALYLYGVDVYLIAESCGRKPASLTTRCPRLRARPPAGQKGISELTEATVSLAAGSWIKLKATCR
jgi:hypothetical protein